MKLPRRAAALLSILVAVVLLMAGTAPAGAATKKVSKDKVGDIKVASKDKRNWMIDILDGRVDTRAGDGHHIRFAVHLKRAVGRGTFRDAPRRMYVQNFATVVRTNTDQYEIHFDNFGDNPGARIYHLEADGYVDITDCTEDGYVAVHAMRTKRSLMTQQVPASCISGSKITDIGYYTAQSVEGYGKTIFASDVLVRKVNVKIHR